tara:strand:+ start:207 stop:554 length:348 start_codon:yes stop_codon:yes gene_type:complete
MSKIINNWKIMELFFNNPNRDFHIRESAKQIRRKMKSLAGFVPVEYKEDQQLTTDNQQPLEKTTKNDMMAEEKDQAPEDVGKEIEKDITTEEKTEEVKEEKEETKKDITEEDKKE